MVAGSSRLIGGRLWLIGTYGLSPQRRSGLTARRVRTSTSSPGKRVSAFRGFFRFYVSQLASNPGGHHATRLAEVISRENYSLIPAFAFVTAFCCITLYRITRV
jgi:hypothetical protein